MTAPGNVDGDATIASSATTPPEEWPTTSIGSPITFATARTSSTSWSIVHGEPVMAAVQAHDPKARRQPGGHLPPRPPVVHAGDELRHAGPQRRTHRKPLIEQAKRAQQQEENGQGRGGKHRQLLGHDGGNGPQVEPRLSEFMVEELPADPRGISGLWSALARPASAPEG